jgi:hypothetical protein
MVNNQISLNPSRIVLALAVVAFLIVVASITAQLAVYLTGRPTIFGLVRLFNLDEEQNVPSFFSTFLLLFATLLLSLITILRKRQAAADVFYWAILSLGFLYLALDEAASIHELLILPVRRMLGGDNLGFFYFAWIVPGILIVLLLALFFSRFLLRLPTKTRWTFLLAAVLYVGGAIGFETIEGRYREVHPADLTFNVMLTAEESLEMMGLIVFIWGLMVYITGHYKEVGLRFGEAGRELPPPGSNKD